MELVIEIPEGIYKFIREDASLSELGIGIITIRDAIKNGTPLPPHGRLIDADELLKRIDKVAKKPSLSIDTINGLCGAVAIIYDMLIETGQEEGESE